MQSIYAGRGGDQKLAEVLLGPLLCGQVSRRLGPHEDPSWVGRGPLLVGEGIIRAYGIKGRGVGADGGGGEECLTDRQNECSLHI